MHSWQNGTRCRDGVKSIGCHSHLVNFEGSNPTCACFCLYVTCFYCFFWDKKERRAGGSGAKGKMHMVCKVQKYITLFLTNPKL